MVSYFMNFSNNLEQLLKRKAELEELKTRTGSQLLKKSLTRQLRTTKKELQIFVSDLLKIKTRDEVNRLLEEALKAALASEEE